MIFSLGHIDCNSSMIELANSLSLSLCRMEGAPNKVKMSYQMLPPLQFLYSMTVERKTLSDGLGNS